jgi:hypothetical protein
MQLATTLTAFILALSGVQAAPSAAMEERQSTGTGIAYARFYNGGGCQEPWLDDIVFKEFDVGCVNNTVTTSNTLAANYGSVNFLSNSATHTCK